MFTLSELRYALHCLTRGDDSGLSDPTDPAERRAMIQQLEAKLADRIIYAIWWVRAECDRISRHCNTDHYLSHRCARFRAHKSGLIA